MRIYILCILVLALITTIGCATTAVEKTKEAYLDRGNSYYRSGKYQRAIKDYNQAIHLDPKFTKAYYNRGLAYGQGKGQFDKAISDYTKAIELDPKDAMAYNNRGVTYKHIGQYDKAIDDYTKAIEINPKYALAYYSRGLIYQDKGEYDKAWEDVHKAENLGFQVHPGVLEALREASGRQK